MKKAIQIDTKDNVGTVTLNISAGENVDCYLGIRLWEVKESCLERA